MKILGIETSCDETGASLVKDGTKILSNVVASSQELHIKSGGIIPEVAAREQVKCIIPVIEETLRKTEDGKQKTVISKTENSNTVLRSSGNRSTVLPSNRPPEIDAIAVTIGPGLIGSLLVGVETAKTLAYLWHKPIIPVNHLLAHVYANWLKNDSPSLRGSPACGGMTKQSQKINEIATLPSVAHNDEFPQFPLIALIVSGGHTELLLMKNHGKYQWLGGTRDDAAGECFDKCARLLGLGYPGGPAIAAAAEKFHVLCSMFHIKLPRPMIDSDDFDFSFSGLKIAVIKELKCSIVLKQWNNKKQILQLAFAHEVQEAITDVLVEKTIKAASKFNVKTILLAGGVAANQRLREKILRYYDIKGNVKIFIPDVRFCTDNAAIVASCAYFNFKPLSWVKVKVNPNLFL